MIEPEDLDPENFKNYEYNQELGLYFFKGVGLGYTFDELAAYVDYAGPKVD